MSNADRTKLFMFLPGVYRGERRLTVAPTRHLTSVLSVPGGTLLTPAEQSFQHQSRSLIPIIESQLNFSRRSSCPCIVDFLSVEDCLSTADRTKLFMFLPGVYRGERRLTVAPARRLGSVLSVPGDSGTSNIRSRASTSACCAVSS